MLFSEVENCHSLVEIHSICDYRHRQYVCFAARELSAVSGKAPLPIWPGPASEGRGQDSL